LDQNTFKKATAASAFTERVIVIKIGAKVMIRRNIYVTLGLVNGTIDNVVAVHRYVDGNHIDSIKIVISDNKEITITKVDIKFKVFHTMVVHRKQSKFPLSLSYEIIIHKIKELRVKIMMDLGMSSVMVKPRFVTSEYTGRPTFDKF